MDGVIVSGNCVFVCDKNLSYVYINNGVVEDLYVRYGKDINFVGVIIINENVYLVDKERFLNWIFKLCKYLGLDVVIVL